MFFVQFFFDNFTCFVFYPTLPPSPRLLEGILHTLREALRVEVVWFVESIILPEFSYN